MAEVGSKTICSARRDRTNCLEDSSICELSAATAQPAAGFQGLTAAAAASPAISYPPGAFRCGGLTSILTIRYALHASHARKPSVC
jgi:hypothetical protein